MTTIAILGAKGRIGLAAARAFLNNGYTVIAVTRDGTIATDLQSVETRMADATDRQALVRATEGADIIFNGLNPPYTDWAQHALPIARNVIAAAKAHGATHLFPGNVYNYGHAIPPVVRETSPFSPSTRKGAIRIEMEALFAEAAVLDSVQTVILRAGDFFGGSRGTWFDLVITAKLAKGVFTWPGPLSLPHAWAYVPDLADAFVALADKRASLNKFDQFLFPGHTMSGDQMRGHIETSLNRRLKLAGVPWTMLKMGGLFVPMWREIHEMAYLWSAPHRLDGSGLQAAIGPLPHRPEEDAIRLALADLGLLNIRNAA
ncbi:NmrA family NAD(P)-binding protein [Aestuariispira ectoiniformans]|uniref:NmrA family NAD(P)-binding protein n=1 Tax=Aestuariispira ectoiniformans TaxID=2775080 RepID=UPI00223BC05C|nr:NAD-dependent epimerase/dehydratase family protein [Aestuariispira ectoiniformans]